MLSKKTNYPVHLGITEAGTEFSGTIKSAVGLGHLLLDGIGDTIRVSLTADPVEEVKAGWEILKSLDLRQRGINIVSCPTCARTGIKVIKIAKDIENSTAHVKKSFKIAIMGCVVNGLGEGREADIAMVGTGPGLALLMKNGKIIKRGKENDVLQSLKKELKKIPK